MTKPSEKTEYRCANSHQPHHIPSKQPELNASGGSAASDKEISQLFELMDLGVSLKIALHHSPYVDSFTGADDSGERYR